MLLTLCAGLAVSANAAEIYRWVDEDGVVHFSDARPRDDASVITLRLEDTNAEDYDPATDPYSVLNQAARISRSRIDTELARSERAQQAREPAGDEEFYPPYTDYDYAYGYRRPLAYVVPLPFRRAPTHQPGAARRQQSALEQTGLSAQRPQSINSGVHRARVERSTVLPVVRPNAPRP